LLEKKGIVEVWKLTRRRKMVEPRIGISAQVDKIRAEVGQCGESRVGCEDLTLLCRGAVSRSARLVGIAQIAHWEHWTFEYSEDGTVRFTPRFEWKAICKAVLEKSG
jgi:hypothetical protein